jgi:hypothetical protein
MKNHLRTVLSIAMALGFGAVALSAQSCAAVNHASNAVQLSGEAVSESVAAGGESVVGSVKVASAVAAVPVWMGSQVIAGSGAVIEKVGESAADVGAAGAHGAEKMWDFATSDPAKRPPLSRDVGLPSKKDVAPKPHDPSPAEAIKL